MSNTHHFTLLTEKGNCTDVRYLGLFKVFDLILILKNQHYDSKSHGLREDAGAKWLYYLATASEAQIQTCTQDDSRINPAVSRFLIVRAWSSKRARCDASCMVSLHAISYRNQAALAKLL